MARPLKEGLDYFPHDTDASNDEKIEALRSIHGNNGYVFYFILLERIYRTPNFELDISASETGEEMKQILARKIAVTMQEFNLMLETAFRWGCFDVQKYHEKGVLTSNGIKKRASAVLEKREKMRNLYRQKISDAETREETPQSKVKKSKDIDKDMLSINRGVIGGINDKNKKIKRSEFVSLSDIEYEKLILRLGTEDRVKRAIEILCNYKGAHGKKYKSDYKAILSWCIKRLEKEEGDQTSFKQRNEKKEIIKSLYLS